MGIIDKLKNQLETNVSNMMKGLEQFGEEPQEQSGGSFCPECGTRIEAGGRFCPSCGTAVTVQSVPEAVPSNPTQPPVPLNPALAEHRRTTIFDFNLADRKDRIKTGKFVVEGVFGHRMGTDLFFKDPEDEQSGIRVILNQRPPELEREQRATVYFHCEGINRILDELVIK